MKVSKAAAIWIDYHNTHSKKNTVRSYQSVIERFCQDFGDWVKETSVIFIYLHQMNNLIFKQDTPQSPHRYPKCPAPGNHR